jgi:DNA-binding transcriptional ArsR family regulator
MKHAIAIDALSALGDDLRLTLFRLLVKRGPEGYPAGEIAGRLDLAPSKLSFHLKVLSEAGLVDARRDGRFVIYAANFDRMNALVAYLTENCCSLGSECATECAPNRKSA